MKLFDKSLGTFMERSFEIVGRYMFVQVKNQVFSCHCFSNLKGHVVYVLCVH